MKIHIKYSVLNKNAKDYLSYNEELQTIIDNLKVRSDNILNNWTSPNSITFNNLMNNFIGDLQVDANRMKRHANIILGIEDDFREKDLEYRKRFEPETISSVVKEEEPYDDK